MEASSRVGEGCRAIAKRIRRLPRGVFKSGPVKVCSNTCRGPSALRVGPVETSKIEYPAPGPLARTTIFSHLRGRAPRSSTHDAAGRASGCWGRTMTGFAAPGMAGTADRARLPPPMAQATPKPLGASAVRGRARMPLATRFSSSGERARPAGTDSRTLRPSAASVRRSRSFVSRVDRIRLPTRSPDRQLARLARGSGGRTSTQYREREAPSRRLGVGAPGSRQSVRVAFVRPPTVCA